MQCCWIDGPEGDVVERLEANLKSTVGGKRPANAYVLLSSKREAHVSRVLTHSRDYVMMEARAC